MNKGTAKLTTFIIVAFVFGIATYKYLFKSWIPYYQKRLYKEPRPLLIKALQFYNGDVALEKKALDLGAGSGNDTAWLLKNGWTVWANDKEIESIKIISRRKDIERYKEQLHLIHADFINLMWSDFPSFDLIYASYALPFLNKNNFAGFWKNVIDKLRVDGILAVHFFDERRQGVTWWEKRGMSFLTREEVIDLFKGFDIELFEESEDYSFGVIARKK